MQNRKNIWEKIINIGVSEELPSSEVKHVKLFNALLVISNVCHILIIPVAVLYLPVTMPVLLWLIILTISYLFMLWLNSMHYFLIARLSFNLLATCFFISCSILLGSNSNLHILLVLVIVAAFFIYPESENISKYLVIVIVIIGFFSCEVWFLFNTNIIDFPAEIMIAIRTTTNSSIIGTFFIFSFYIVSNYNRAEAALEAERQISENLLHNIIPSTIADRLKSSPEKIADGFQATTILFSDIVGFTPFSKKVSPEELVNILNQIFSIFDSLTDKYNLEKIKTIGDAYMVAGGIPSPRDDHAEAIANMALDMNKELEKFNGQNGHTFQIRTGIHSGEAVAGVIGIKKFIYDLWGDTVNTASRMESHGLPGEIQVSEETYELLRDNFSFEERGEIDVKGKGLLKTYLLKGRL